MLLETASTKKRVLPPAVNVLINSPMILHITNREFFQHNILHSDQ